MRTRKTWRRNVYRTETWRGKRVKVARSPRGRFVSWHKIRPYRYRKDGRIRTVARYEQRALIRVVASSGKRVAVYGKAWTRRGIESRRWEIYARSGKQLYGAVRFAVTQPPRKRFTVISAEDMEDIGPEDVEGEWLDRPEIES
jgi:hypothetical protein